MTSSSAVATLASSYWNCHHHCLPVTVTCSAFGPGVLGEVEDRGDGRHRDRHEQHRGQDRPTDLELGVAVDLLRVLVDTFAVAEFDREHDDGAEHEDADDGRDHADRPEEVVDLVGRLPLRFEGVLAVVGRGRAATREYERQRDGGDEDEPASPRAAWRHVPFRIPWARSRRHQRVGSPGASALYMGRLRRQQLLRSCFRRPRGSDPGFARIAKGRSERRRATGESQ